MPLIDEIDSGNLMWTYNAKCVHYEKFWNFSTLKWFIGGKRTCFVVEKLKAMTKIRAYNMTNIQ
ncbi:34698_t:CDS:2, partial [Gigaspora margarita]